MAYYLSPFHFNAAVKVLVDQFYYDNEMERILIERYDVKYADYFNSLEEKMKGYMANTECIVFCPKSDITIIALVGVVTCPKSNTSIDHFY